MLYPYLAFDLDGTILDSEATVAASIRYAVAAMGAPEPASEVVRACIGPPFSQWMPKLIGSHNPARLAEAIAAYRSRYGESFLKEARLFDGMEAALHALHRRGHRLFVVTSKAEPYPRQLIEHLGLASIIDGIYAPQPSEHHHDKADLIRALLIEHRLPTHQLVMIGDREADMLAAKRNGLAAIGVTWGYGTPTELTLAEAIAQSPADLVAMLADESA